MQRLVKYIGANYKLWPPPPQEVLERIDTEMEYGDYQNIGPHDPNHGQKEQRHNYPVYAYVDGKSRHMLFGNDQTICLQWIIGQQVGQQKGPIHGY